MSERPPSQLPNAVDRPLQDQATGKAGRAAGGRFDADDIWDPPPESEAKLRLPLASLPRRSGGPTSRALTEGEIPPPILQQVDQPPPLSDVRYIPGLPQASRRRSGSGWFWFAVCVLLPMAAGWYYYGRIASNQYVAEFRFSVRDASTQATGSAASGLLAILGTQSSSANHNYVVVDFLKSRQVIDTLQQRIGITRLYAKPEIDWWSRYNAARPIESFIRYWNGMIVANFDQITGIASVKVRAFSADDAFLIANTLVKLSEELVNEIANRTYLDAVRFAQGEVEKAEQRLKQTRERLTEFRNRNGVIDPNTSVVASSASLVQTLRATLAQQEAQLATMTKQNLLPNAPTVQVLKTQIQSTKEQLDRLAREVSKNAEGRPLSAVMVEYEQLDLERQFAQTMLTGALSALDTARANAVAQHLYITPYVRPSLPTTPTYPQRVWSVMEVGGVAFIFWVIALLITRAIRERLA